MNEISVTKGLDHPNLMKLEEVHETSNSIYLVNELLDGGMFSSKFSSFSTPLDTIKKYMVDILSGLAYLDSRNIMHRDIKPDNILFRSKDNSQLVLVDFGLASNVDEKEYLFKRCGTPGYVAPEVINAPSSKHRKFSPKCDVFSAGVMLYMLYYFIESNLKEFLVLILIGDRVTGKAPFSGKELDDIIDSNKAAVVDFSHPKLKNAGEKGMELLKRMLDKNPETRISAQEALESHFFDGVPKLPQTPLSSSKKIEIDIKEEECNVVLKEDEEESSRCITVFQERYD